MSRAAVLRQYQRALSQWPADVLRPDVSFPKTMLTRTENHLGATNLSSADKKDIREGNDGTDTTAELEQVNALYSLLENRYSRKYPLSERLLKPQSNPEYYNNLLRELEEAPKRSWLSRKINQWKGFLRFT